MHMRDSFHDRLGLLDLSPEISDKRNGEENLLELSTFNNHELSHDVNADANPNCSQSLMNRSILSLGEAPFISKSSHQQIFNSLEYQNFK